MFTGLIESQAVLRDSRKGKKGSRLTFEWIGKTPHLRVGESVAVDGTCLTLVSVHGKKFSADAIPETLRSTTLGQLMPGRRVNVERALRVGDRVGGHWVTGHVDGVGVIRKWDRRGTNFSLKIEAPADTIQCLVKKGSIAVDGISFTLQELGPRHFVVGVIPQTYRVTALQWKRAGDPVNLEVDLFAKLVQDFLKKKNASSLSARRLRRQGF